MARQYNNIYTELVAGPYDMVGHVAYSLYKADKTQYIEKFKIDNKRDPTEKELRPFHDISCLPGAIERYQTSAIALLKFFLDETLAATAQKAEKECYETFEERIRSACSPLVVPKKKRLWESIWTGVTSAVLVSIFWTVMTFVIKNQDVEFNISITPKQPTQTIEVVSDTNN